MFRWLRNWIQDADREIFIYHDGSRTRRADPAVVLRKLIEHPSYLPYEHPQLAAKGDQDALREMLAACQQVFGVQPYDGDKRTGLLEEEQIQLMIAFGEFCGNVKKNTSLSLISAPYMDSLAGSATNSDSDSPSTWIDSDSGPPTPFTRELPPSPPA